MLLASSFCQSIKGVDCAQLAPIVLLCFSQGIKLFINFILPSCVFFLCFFRLVEEPPVHCHSQAEMNQIFQYDITGVDVEHVPVSLALFAAL